jgi:hypothetical protein
VWGRHLIGANLDVVERIGVDVCVGLGLLGRVGGEFDLDTLGLHGEHMAFWDCMGFKRLKNETMGLMALGVGVLASIYGG